VAALVSIVVAADERNAIGRAGGLPWHLPDDLKHFKALTLGKPILMGRKTWDSIGRPLPGRHNIVITRQPGFAAPGVTVVRSLEDAYTAAGDVPEACVIGGADIFRLALPRTDVIHLTRVHAIVDADTFLPPLDATTWQEASREDHAADARHAHAYSFIELRRRAPARS
jgi:dihydrofolate reductase